MLQSLNQIGQNQVGKGLKEKKVFGLLADTFSALGDSSRVQIVWVLSKGELCVGDIAALLDVSQPAVSHHLRTLRNLQLVKVRRDGRTSYYSLDDDHINRLLHEGIKHVEELVQK
ncbi:metalloregulator ArsR/SmtB family transcription factor [bacterium]|jgi:DNA-binding transcriptional ArsR family regulator|nr:metalloregulator ArsR/SmtB family transcription factor [bacterium]